MSIFISCLATQFKHFIELRRFCGIDYDSGANHLSHFDRFLVEKAWQEPRITRQIIDDYLASRQHLAPNTYKNQFCALSKFCEYLASSDPQSYLPESIESAPSSTPYKPYIYTLSEMQALMKAAKQMTPIDTLRPQTYCTLLGVLCATGMRIGEAISLNIRDFYEDEARLFIVDGKFHKARWIPLSPSASAALASYIEKREQFRPCTPSDPLFINLQTHRLLYSNVNRDFQRLLVNANIVKDEHNHPKLHGLRHTFAVRRLLDWYRQGKDVNAKLPSLATYMGHVDIASTHVYLHPTPELLAQVNQRFYSHFLTHVKSAEVLS